MGFFFIMKMKLYYNFYTIYFIFDVFLLLKNEIDYLRIMNSNISIYCLLIHDFLLKSKIKPQHINISTHQDLFMNTNENVRFQRN